jgi:hypothetical protein
MDRVLTLLAQELAQMIATSRYARRSLHITLSAALCPASAFTAPQTVRRWDERQSIAYASAAAAVGMQADQIVCETDQYQSGVTASMGRHLFDDLKQWASQHRCRVASAQPLWAVASQCQAARSTAIKGILLQEPDAVTVVAVKHDGRTLASTLAGHPDRTGNAMQVRRWLVGLGLNQSDMLRFGFVADPQPVVQQAPGTWVGHWALAAEIS